MISFKKLYESLEPEDSEARIANRKKEQDEAHDLHKSLVNHYSNYTDKHKKSIKDYTHQSFYLNDFHWKTHNNIPTTTKYTEDTKNMDSVVNAHKTPQNLTVYSKSIHDPRTLKNYKDIVHHPAYLSASIQRSVAKNLKWNHHTDKETGEEHHHILKIDVPRGSPGAYVDHHSSLSSQKEFIIPRGSNLKYHKTESQKFGKDNYHYHHMELL
jgi:hypothetical protein